MDLKIQYKKQITHLVSTWKCNELVRYSVQMNNLEKQDKDVI